MNPRALDTFGRASQNVTDVYILWILSTLKEFDGIRLKTELSNLQQVAMHTNDPYILGLCAGALINFNKTEDAIEIAQRIVLAQNKSSGAVEGAASSITSSSGINLKVETTSLAILAWLDSSPIQFASSIELAFGFLLRQVKDGGRYGSTQATVLALKALVRYSEVFGGLRGSGTFLLSVNGIKVDSFEFDERD